MWGETAGVKKRELRYPGGPGLCAHASGCVPLPPRRSRGRQGCMCTRAACVYVREGARATPLPCPAVLRRHRRHDRWVSEPGWSTALSCPPLCRRSCGRIGPRRRLGPSCIPLVQVGVSGRAASLMPQWGGPPGTTLREAGDACCSRFPGVAGCAVASASYFVTAPLVKALGALGRARRERGVKVLRCQYSPLPLWWGWPVSSMPRVSDWGRFKVVFYCLSVVNIAG